MSIRSRAPRSTAVRKWLIQQAGRSPGGDVFEEPTSTRPSLLRRIVQSPTSATGLVIVALLVAACAFTPIFVHYDPTRQDLANALLPTSWAHPLGTDGLGRDELIRLVYGGRYSMSLGLMAIVIGAGFGVPLGVAAGYYGGKFDLAIQAVTDVLLSFPNLLLALLLVAGLGVGLRNVTIAVAISSIPSFIRLSRSAALVVRALAFVEAATALGQSSLRILMRHVLPNSLAPVIVNASLQIGTAVLVAAGLGFLGLGVQPPTPEWGTMLGESRNYIFRVPALSVYPGIAIFLVVVGFNLIGDGLRDVLDPRSQR